MQKIFFHKLIKKYLPSRHRIYIMKIRTLVYKIAIKIIKKVQFVLGTKILGAHAIVLNKEGSSLKK